LWKEPVQPITERRTFGRIKQRRPTGRIRRPRSILIVQCDTEKLVRDVLSIAADMEFCLRLVAPEADVQRVEGTNLMDLLSKLGECADTRRGAFPEEPGFDFIVLIGHSDREGIRLASDKWARWEELGAWLEPLKPNRIALVACQAGRERPVCNVFDQVPSLREIYSTPGSASAQQVQIVSALTLILVKSWQSQRDLKDLAFIFSAAVLKEPVFCWKRNKQSVDALRFVNELAEVIDLLKLVGIWRPAQ
jgi:hypothetical protein